MRVILISLLLLGCSSTIPTPVVVAQAPVYHPGFPAPYSVCDIDWEVLENNEKPIVAISYNDNLTAAICDKDKDRYIDQLLQLTCYYRSEIHERICTKEINDNKDK